MEGKAWTHPAGKGPIVVGEGPQQVTEVSGLVTYFTVSEHDQSVEIHLVLAAANEEGQKAVVGVDSSKEPRFDIVAIGDGDAERDAIIQENSGFAGIKLKSVLLTAANFKPLGSDTPQLGTFKLNLAKSEGGKEYSGQAGAAHMYSRIPAGKYRISASYDLNKDSYFSLESGGQVQVPGVVTGTFNASFDFTLN